MLAFARYMAVSCLLAMLGCAPASDPVDSGSVPPATGASDAASPATAPSTQMVSLRVPKMHCPFACWPKVKETLEKQDGVAEVTLAEQADENAIDNPVVHVRAAESFDASQAIDALAAAGFSDATLDE